MPHRLDGMYAKLKRADFHLDNLKAVVDVFNIKPYRVVCNANYQRKEVIYHLKDVAPFPLEGSVIIGEIAYQWRSALDHLAACMVDNPAGTVTIGTDCEFPIWLNLLANNGRKYPGRFTDTYNTLSAIIQGKFDDLQPFNPHSKFAQNLHPLWLLHGINNIDKHRSIHVINSVTCGDFGIGGNFGVDHMIVNGAASEENAVLVKFTPIYLPTGKPPITLPQWIDSLKGTEIDTPSTAQIKFGPGSDQATSLPVLDTLEAIRAYIYNDVLEPTGLLAEIK